MGIFEFRVCSIDQDPSADATQSCLDLNILPVDNGLTQYSIDRTFTTVNVNVTLPPDLVCKHCVFQWKYRTGNSWGVTNGRGCLGCGRENEEFYGCSDIAIVSSVESIVDPTITNATTLAKEAINQAKTVSRKCTSTIVFSQSFNLFNIMDQYCQVVCPSNCASDKLIGNEKLYNGCVDSCNKLCACQ